MTSTRRKSKKDAPPPIYSEADKNIFFLKETLLNSSGNSNIKMKLLRHPGYEESSYFIVPSQTSNENDHQKIYEIIEFNESHRSWFINDYFTSNGRIYMTIPIDELFFALHYLKKQCEQQFKPLEQLEDEELPATIDILAKILTSEKLLKISDEKVYGDLKVYKYNKEKTLKWLSLKVKYLAFVLKKKNVNAGTGATSANFTKGGSPSDCTQDDYLQLASEILSAYISTDLYDELKVLLNINDKKHVTSSTNTTKNKRKSTTENISSNLNKKTKTSNDSSIDENQDNNCEQSPKTQHKSIEKKQTSKEKSLAKAAAGTKSISSFFQKKVT